MVLGKRRVTEVDFEEKGVCKAHIKDKRAHFIMSLFESQTKLTPVQDKIPVATLKPEADLSIYDVAHHSDYFSSDFQFIWSLASTLYKMDKSKNYSLLKDWLKDLVRPGLESELKKQSVIHNDDPFVYTFVYLTFGERQLACEEAQKLNDYHLALCIIHSEFKDMKTNIKMTIDTLQSSGEWNKKSTLHKKCWYIISGRLDYILEEKFAVTEGVYWQRQLSMYIWYKPYPNTALSLVDYNQSLHISQSYKNDLNPKKHLITPNEDCLWYQLLQWWIGDKNLAKMEEWPPELPWLLSIYKERNNVDEVHIDKWLQNLKDKGLTEWAIYAALFTANSKEKVCDILREYNSSKETRLIHEYYIPKLFIHTSKALYAHDTWDYAGEYQHLMNGALLEKAKVVLLNFLLPKLFKNNRKKLLKSIDYMDIYLKEKEDDTIELMKRSYNFLLRNNPVDSPERIQLLKELGELKSAFGLEIFMATVRKITRLVENNTIVQ